MVVDFHTHVWPDAIAERALSAASADVERQGDGKVSSLLAALAVAGVERAVCLGIANFAKYLDATNRFAASLPEPLIGFGAVHVERDVETNVRSLRENCLRGVKLNPPFQGFALDDPRLAEILDALQGEFVVLTHVGEGGNAGTSATCTPRMIREMTREFPRLDLVAAHFGGYRQIDEATREVIGLRVYIDTSWPPGIASIGLDRVRRLISQHGPERVLFGSDWPMGSPAREVAALESLGLADDDLAAILGGNARKLLRIENT